MHEYLHKYFENINKLEKKLSIRNMRPLSNVRPPPRPGVTGGSSSGSGSKNAHLSQWRGFEPPKPPSAWLRH